MRNPIRRPVGASALLAVAVALPVATAAPAVAAAPPVQEPFTSVYEAGQVCEFPIARTTYQDGHVTSKELTDADGNPVGFQVAGTRSTAEYTNLLTGATVTIPGGGFRSTHILVDRINGTWMITTDGYEQLIFDERYPDGPSFTVYFGHMVRQITDGSPDPVTIFSFRGTSRDICAELS